MALSPLLPVRTVAPAASLIDLADAKAHLRLDGSDSDDYVLGLIAAAEAYLDGFAGVVGRALVTQTWRRSFDRFPCGRVIRLPLGPLQSVTSVTYYDGAGDAQTLSAGDYHAVVDAIGPCVQLAANATWPFTDDRPDAVTVTWVCGYGAAAAVPSPIVHAAKLLIGHWYEQREAVNAGSIMTPVQLAVDALIHPFRAVGPS